MMFPRSFAPMRMFVSCLAVGFFSVVGNLTAIETAVTTKAADVLYWSWNKGDVYDVQMQTKTNIQLKQGQQDLKYHSTTTIDGVLVVQSLSPQGIAEVHWMVRRIRVDHGEGKKRISIDSDSQLAADKIQPAEQSVFISFPKGEFALQTIWEESKNPLLAPMNNPIRFRYQYRGLNADRGHVVGITGKYAFADSGEQSKVLKIDHEQISGRLVTDAKQNYVKRVDLELLVKTTAGQGNDAITTEQSDTQSIAIEKK